MLNQKASTWIFIVLVMTASMLFVVMREARGLQLENEKLGITQVEQLEEMEELRGRHLTLVDNYEQLAEEYEELSEDLENLQALHKTLKQTKEELQVKNRELERKFKTKQSSRGESRKNSSVAKDMGHFTATAYDNSVQSQGKWVNQTATGFSLKGHTLESARCIAVDPKVIPLGSKVRLTFSGEYSHLNGIYTAYDTGGAIKGRKIDVFFGDGNVKQAVRNFGRRQVKVEILK